MEEQRQLCVLDAGQISAILSYPLLIEHLRLAFQHGEDAIAAPPRQHHTIPSSSSSPSEQLEGTLLIMPAWHIKSSSSSYMGVKLVSAFPNNSSLHLPTVSASYLLSSALTGLPLAFLDGKEITLWRTACVSALAAHYLATPDARSLLMVGAGDLAPHLIKAHCTIRPSIEAVYIWNRTHSKAQCLFRALQDDIDASTSKSLPHPLAGKVVMACADLEMAARSANIISCATFSDRPLIQRIWLKPGTHLDLVGSFTPTMRECDEDAIRKGMVFVDTMVACEEAGELVGHAATVEGTLSQLARGEKQGRQQAWDLTVFKSVGCALVDLATAQLVYEKHQLTR